MAALRQWRYRSAVLAAFVVALGNISLFLGAALAQGNLKERVGDECSIANIKQYAAQMGKNFSWLLQAKFEKCALVAVPWLIKQTKIDNVDAQVTAISLLAMIGTDASSAAPRLIELLQSSQNEDLRILAVGALPEVVSSENVKSIIAVLDSTLKDRNQNVRFGAAFALIEMYDAVKLRHPNNNFFQIISGDIVSTLINAFKDDDIRPDAAKALVQIGKYAVPALISTLQDNDKNVRAAAADVLGGRGIGKDAKDAIPALISALQDNDKDVRAAAAEALGGIGKDAKDVVPALISTLQDNDKDVRAAAAEALGGIGKDAKDAIPALISTLQQDKDKDVRYAAAEALKKIDKEAFPETNSFPLQESSSTIPFPPDPFPPELLRHGVLRFGKKNPPKACKNELTRFLLEWKC